MKEKFLLSALCSLLISAPAFAASNPFSDVPAGHWAYDSVAKLANDGVIDGYGDGSFRGDKNITRYEMAQMIARAMAKNPQGDSKRELDKLAAEFSEELQNLGVRVAKLEKHADVVEWKGKLRYEYLNTYIEDGINDNTSKNRFQLELYPKAEINEHWTANAKLVAYTNLGFANDDEDMNATYFKLRRAWAEGKYGNFTVQLGKVPILSESDFLTQMDSEASGGQIIYGNKYKFKLFAGRFNNRQYFFTEFFNDRKEKFNFGIGYHRVKSDSYPNNRGEGDGHYNSTIANIYTLGLGYRFDKNIALKGVYARNPSGDHYAYRHRHSASIELDYKGAKLDSPGSYGIFAAYRHYGHMAIIKPTYDAEIIGLKGYHFGIEFVPAKNLTADVEYYFGERVSPRYRGKHTRKIYTKVEWHF